MNWVRKQNVTTEHQRLREQLSAYLDGELSAQEQHAVQCHLATCAECRWNLETLKLTVQWTRDLPSVPIPRVFTIPAQPVRARRQSWSVPLLQGATALVALLLVFAFVGDFALTGLAPARAPESVVLMERQAVDVLATQPVEAEVTVLVEMEVAAQPAEPEAETVVEKAVAEAPAPAADVATEAAAEEAALPTPEPEARSMGAAGFETPTDAPLAAAGGGEAATAEPLAAAAPEGIGAGEPVSMSYAAEVTPTYVTEVTPTTVASPSPAAETPLAVAEAGEPAGIVAEDEAERGALAQARYEWLRPAEVALGVLFILLAAATAVVMVQRRQSS